MTSHAEKMRALEELRAVENDLSLRVHQLRRWISADLKRTWSDYGFAGEPPSFPYADRIEYWWRPAQGHEGEPAVDRVTFERIGILAEWLEAFDSAVADRALAENRPGVERYVPGSGDGTPILPVLERIFLDLWTAQGLREKAGIEAS